MCMKTDEDGADKTNNTFHKKKTNSYLINIFFSFTGRHISIYIFFLKFLLICISFTSENYIIYVNNTDYVVKNLISYVIYCILTWEASLYLPYGKIH